MKKKVRVIKRYHDMQLKKIMKKDEEFEVDEERAKYLVRQGMVKILEAQETAKKAEKKEEKVSDKKEM